jgi:hypothetical protein
MAVPREILARTQKNIALAKELIRVSQQAVRDSQMIQQAAEHEVIQSRRDRAQVHKKKKNSDDTLM